VPINLSFYIMNEILLYYSWILAILSNFIFWIVLLVYWLKNRHTLSINIGIFVIFTAIQLAFLVFFVFDLVADTMLYIIYPRLDAKMRIPLGLIGHSFLILGIEKLFFPKRIHFGFISAWFGIILWIMVSQFPLLEFLANYIILPVISLPGIIVIESRIFQKEKRDTKRLSRKTLLFLGIGIFGNFLAWMPLIPIFSMYISLNFFILSAMGAILGPIYIIRGILTIDFNDFFDNNGLDIHSKKEGLYD